MYIAGRLRTASMPPRTLMEVASYLWPPVFPAAASFSAMGRASPQIASGCNFVLQLSIKAAGRRSRGSARHLLAWLRRVTLPIGFAHPKLGSNTFEGALMRRRNSKGCGSIPSRSEIFGETRRSFLIFPCGKGNMRREIGFSCPGANKKNRGKFGPDIVPFRRKSERIYCIEIGVNSQGETDDRR